MEEVVAGMEAVVVELGALDVAMAKKKTNNKPVVDSLIAGCLLEPFRETENF